MNNKFLCVLISLSFFFMSCLKKQEKTIRIGLNPWPGYEFLYLAKELGLYKKADLDVKIIDLSSLTDVKRAFERGQIDVMASTSIEVIMTREESDKKAKIFYVADYSNGSDIIIGVDSIKSVKDLNKVRIGIEPGTLDVYTTFLALKEANLTFDSIEVVPMSQIEMASMIKDKKIDAAATYPPFSLEVLPDTNVHEIFNSSQLKGLITDVLSADESFILSNTDKIEKIKHVFDQAVDYYENNKEIAIGIMAKHQNISSEEFAEGLSGLEVLRFKDQKEYFENGKLLNIMSNVDQAFRSNNLLKKEPCALECIQ